LEGHAHVYAFASLPFGFTHGQDGWLRRASSLYGRYHHTCGRDKARPSSVEQIMYALLSNKNSAEINTLFRIDSP